MVIESGCSVGRLAVLRARGFELSRLGPPSLKTPHLTLNGSLAKFDLRSVRGVLTWNLGLSQAEYLHT